MPSKLEEQTFICAECGQPYRRKPYQATTYCSRKCQNIEMSRRSGLKARQMASQRRGNPAVLPDRSVLIPLDKGLWARVDSEDAAFAAQWNWKAHEHGYAVWRKNKILRDNGTTHFRMHRLILGRMLGRELNKGEMVDHINHDRLDNRRSNLRVCTTLQNSHNFKKYKGSTSKYKGLCWDKTRNKWKVEIRFDQIKYMVGRFDDEDEAAWHRDQWCLALHDDFAVLNFEYV